MSYININVSISDIARDIASDLDVMFNELGCLFPAPVAETGNDEKDRAIYKYNHEQAQTWLDRRVGRELDESGKRFVLELANWFDRQFPGER